MTARPARIFQARLGRLRIVAVAGGDHVERERHQFEPEIERVRSPAEISTIMPSVESSTRMAYSKMRRDGSDRTPSTAPASRPSDQGHDLHEAGEVIDDEAAAEGHGLRQAASIQHADHDQQAHGEAVTSAVVAGSRKAPSINSAMARAPAHFRHYRQQLIAPVSKLMAWS